MSENVVKQDVEETITECGSSKEPIDIKGPIVLLVEGKDDKYFCEAFIDYLKLENIQTFFL